MSNQSPLRRYRRELKRKNGVTFTERVREAIRTGKPVKDVVFTKDGKA